MKKALPIVLVLVVVAIGAYFLFGKGKSGTSSEVAPPESSEESPEEGAEGFSGALRDAVKLGVAMKCTYKVGGDEYEGFIKGENYRGKIKTAEGESGEVIVKDNCMWTWTEGETEGVKTCFEMTEVEAEEAGAEEADVWEQPQGASSPDVTYTCLPTAVTDDKFMPPTDVNFMDLEKMMEGFGLE